MSITSKLDLEMLQSQIATLEATHKALVFVRDRESTQDKDKLQITLALFGLNDIRTILTNLKQS